MTPSAYPENSFPLPYLRDPSFLQVGATDQDIKSAAAVSTGGCPGKQVCPAFTTGCHLSTLSPSSPELEEKSWPGSEGTGPGVSSGVGEKGKHSPNLATRPH